MQAVGGVVRGIDDELFVCHGPLLATIGHAIHCATGPQAKSSEIIDSIAVNAIHNETVEGQAAQHIVVSGERKANVAGSGGLACGTV